MPPASTLPSAVAAVLAAAAALPADDVVRRKRDVLRAVKAGLFPPPLAIPILVVGACDAHHEIVAEAEDLLRRAGSGAGEDAENPTVVAALLSLLVGQGQAAGGAGAAAAAVTTAVMEGRGPASPAVRARAAAMLERSRYFAGRGSSSSLVAPTPSAGATVASEEGRGSGVSPPPSSSILPGAPPSVALRAVFECLFGSGTNLKLQTLGVKMAVAVFQLTDPLALRPLAALYLQALMRLLNTESATTSSASSADTAASVGSVQPPPPPSDLLSTLAAAATSAASAARAARADATYASVVAFRDSGDRERLVEAAYSAVGTLAHASPGAFIGSVAVPALLFARLQSEATGMRLSIAEALSSLGGVYEVKGDVSRGGDVSGDVTGPSEDVKEGLHSLLAVHAESEEARVRQGERGESVGRC